MKNVHRKSESQRKAKRVILQLPKGRRKIREKGGKRMGVFEAMHILLALDEE